MKSVMQFAPQDGFKLTDAMLNKTYTVTGVRETNFGDVKSFVCILEDEAGNIINLPASEWKRARVLGKSDVKTLKPYGTTKNCFPRSQAEDVWTSSIYFHGQDNRMKADEEFVVPASIKIKYAILAETSEGGKTIQILQPNLYKGYRRVVADYQTREQFPTFEDFKMELKKTEGRIPGLPEDLTEPTLNDWVVEGDVGNYRHNLIFEDIAD